VLKRLILAIFVIVILVIAWEWITFPDVAKLATQNPATTAFMDERRAELRAEGKDDHLLYAWAPYAKISPYLRRGVLVAEDNAFYEHNGVDVRGFEEALRKDWERKKMTHGGSTITQQLAKNLWLSPSRNPLRKIKEYFLARSLENHLSKKRILELYLNVVEMGERVYGAEAAARYYFHESASALTPQQAALLAGCLPNPRLMNPGAPNRRLRWRQRMILSRMRRWGYLFEKDVLTSKPPAPPPPPAPAPATTTTVAPPAATETTDTALQQTPPNDTATPVPPETTTTMAAPETTPPASTATAPPTATTT
jgi:monofunctional biosynthetic peptidoglycan transglycosylase